jgi:hypothetical protein
VNNLMGWGTRIKEHTQRERERERERDAPLFVAKTAVVIVCPIEFLD